MRRSAAAAAVILALIPPVYLAWQARDLPHLGYFHDDSIYLVSAKSLAEGAGYRIASLPDAPYQTKYPPLYPLLLAAVWSPERPLAANLAVIAALAWAMVPLYVLAARLALSDLGARGAAAWWLSAVIAVNPSVAVFGISLLSELPFSVLLIGALALTERARRGPWWLAALAGTLAGMAYLTRSAGIVLLASGPAVLWASQRRRHAGAYAAAMAPAVAGWTWWSHAHRAAGGDGTVLYYTDYLGFYLRDLGSLPVIVWRNFDVLTNSMGGMLLLTSDETWWTRAIARVLAAAAVVGVVRLVRRDGWNAYTAFAPAYLVTLLVWNFLPDHRFLLPVLPLLVYAQLSELRRVGCAVGAAWRTRRLPERVTAACVVALLGGVLLLGLAKNLASYRVALPAFVARHRADLAASRGAYEWIAAHTPPGARLFAYLDPVLHLYTGRHASRMAVPPGLFYNERTSELAPLYASLPDFARAHGLTYLLVTPRDLTGDLSPADRAATQRGFRADPRLHLLYDSPGASVYRVD